MNKPVQTAFESVPKCPLCGSENSKIYREIQNYTIRECDDCGLKRLDPRPTSELLNRLYGEEYFLERVPDNPKKAERHDRRSFSKRFRLMRRFSNGKKLLDVGCGEGKWLLFAKENGIDVTGIDVSPVAQKHKDLKIIVGSIGQTHIDEKFDIVTAFHSIEHTPDPIATLKWINNLLTNNGTLVAEVPNVSSYDAQNYGSEWDGWKLPYHLFHFEPTTFEKALRTTGFEPTYWRFDSSKFLRSKIKKIPIIHLAHGLLAHLKSGTAMLVVAKKYRSV